MFVHGIHTLLYPLARVQATHDGPALRIEKQFALTVHSRPNLPSGLSESPKILLSVPERIVARRRNLLSYATVLTYVLLITEIPCRFDENL